MYGKRVSHWSGLGAGVAAAAVLAVAIHSADARAPLPARMQLVLPALSGPPQTGNSVHPYLSELPPFEQGQLCTTFQALPSQGHLVVILGGEGQFPPGPNAPPDENHGVFQIGKDLQTTGYTVWMFDEDCVTADGSGPVYDSVVVAIRDSGVKNIAVVGYSHGGGSTHDLCSRLKDNKVKIGDFTIRYTAYIDGIKNGSDIDLRSEDRRPPGTEFHMNIYQRRLLNRELCSVRGTNVDGANDNINVNSYPWGTNLHHCDVDDDVRVKNVIKTFLKCEMPLPSCPSLGGLAGTVGCQECPPTITLGTPIIPAVSEWGLVAIGLLTVVCGTIVLRNARRRMA